MSKKKTDHKAKQIHAPAPPKKAGATSTSIFASPFVRLAVTGAIALVTFLFLSNGLTNLFTNWDDTGYVVNNSLIKNLTVQGIRDIFSPTHSVLANYHPLTILSYALEYHSTQLDPWLYHFDNLLLHIFNTLLVFWLVRLLTGRYSAAIITALLFALHPMHVESVAWVAGRKDVLYGFFYIAACISWVYHLRREGTIRWVYYALTLLLFFASLLSKPVAVTLPLALLLIDYWERRRWSAALIAAQLPFFALSLFFGILSIRTQASTGSLATSSTGYSVMERGLLGFYSLATYLWKTALPLQLRNFYPYPGRPSALPVTLFIYPLVILALLGVLWRYARHNRVVVFGLLFFLINIALLLQFIPVGLAIVADRYSYISYIGLFFIVGYLVSEYFKDDLSNTAGNLIMAAALLVCLAFGYLSHERDKVWYNSMSLWYSNIDIQPLDPNAYNNLGDEYYTRALDATDPALQRHDFDSAIVLLKKSVEIKPAFIQSYIMMGEIMRNYGHYEEAIQNFNTATRIDSTDGGAYLSKAILFCITQKPDSAKTNFDIALQRSPYFPEAHSSYGNYWDMTGHPDSAMAHYSIAIAQNPDLVMPYLNRGKVYLYRYNDIVRARADFEKLLQLKPDYAEAAYYLGVCTYRGGDKAKAKVYVDKAITLGYRAIDTVMYNMISRP